MPKIFAKITLSGGLVDKHKENHAIIAVILQFGYKSGKVEGLTSIREVPKTVFGLRLNKVAASISDYNGVK